ncbi:MAG: hypothetical protein IKM50_02125 [Tidjanibacter sp.]|nr:hypothetical protein [Tidjanibacter sp.]MBR6813325.1 hypothetical protein [Tidjanibacter sp.]
MVKIMSTGKYIRRALGYFVKIVALVIGIYALLWVTGSSNISAEAFWSELFTSRRGLLLWGAVLAVSLLYPLYGFVRRTVKADVVADWEEIHRAFIVAGYNKGESQGGVTVFRVSSPVRRLIMFGEDIIIVTDNGDGTITLDGIRKEVVQIEFRIHTFVDNKTTDPTEEHYERATEEAEVIEAEVVETEEKE